MDLAPVQADILQYVKAGANGFILKDASINDFLITIRTVSEGSTVLPPLLIDSLFSQIVEHAVREGRPKLKDAVRMTKREKEVIRFVSDGMSNKEIAGLLGISHQTVKNHVTSILRKFGVEDRTQAVVYALKRGWVNLQETDINKPQE